MLLKTLRFPKLHLLTQFYVHNVLYSQTKETEVTKYPFVQWVRKQSVTFGPLYLRSWKQLLLMAIQWKTQIYFWLQTTLGPLGSSSSLPREANTRWVLLGPSPITSQRKHLLTLGLRGAPLLLLTAMPQGGRAGQPPSFRHKRAQHVPAAGCTTSGRAAATAWARNSLLPRLNTRGQWWQLPSRGERLPFSLFCPWHEGTKNLGISFMSLQQTHHPRFPFSLLGILSERIRFSSGDFFVLAPLSHSRQPIRVQFVPMIGTGGAKAMKRVVAPQQEFCTPSRYLWGEKKDLCDWHRGVCDIPSQDPPPISDEKSFLHIYAATCQK